MAKPVDSKKRDGIVTEAKGVVSNKRVFTLSGCLDPEQLAKFKVMVGAADLPDGAVAGAKGQVSAKSSDGIAADAMGGEIVDIVMSPMLPADSEVTSITQREFSVCDASTQTDPMEKFELFQKWMF
jgi:hypothetical protein